MSPNPRNETSAPVEGTRRVTIYDVAKEAGVAASTVSRAFSRPGRVNAETAEKIRQAAQRLGYRMRPIMRAESVQKTRLLAFVVSDMGNPVFTDIMRGFQHEANQHGYTVILIDSQEDDLKERRALEKVLPLVDGVTLTSSRMSDSAISQIAKVKPVAVVNRLIYGVPSILPDVARGMRRSVEYLASLGHTKLVYLAGPEASWADGVRWRGISEACYELNVQVRRLGPFAPSLQGGLEAAKLWKNLRASAVIAYNDLLAIGFMKAIQRAGLHAPDDVSVVGIDNSISAQLTTPTLTSIGPPKNTLGISAARTVIAQLERKTEPSAQQMMVAMKLFVRDSTGTCHVTK